MENAVFYVKYGDHQPVKIETLFNFDEERKRPLKDVSDLIKAYKNTVHPALSEVSVQDISLYSLINGVKTQLDPSTPLPTLGPAGASSCPLYVDSEPTKGYCQGKIDKCSHR
jgi:hypothetical protein